MGLASQDPRLTLLWLYVFRWMCQHSGIDGALFPSQLLDTRAICRSRLSATHPEGDGAERAVRLALEDADLSPEDVRYVNAHGTGTELNDRTEGGVVARVFGNRQPAISSIKGSTGHGLGASGSIEAVVLVEAIRRGELPPNTGMTTQDPDIPLTDIVTDLRPWEPGPALTNSFGFGGHNTVLAFGPA